MIEHEFLTVGERRWCVNCDLFQVRHSDSWPSIADCPRTTPRAQAIDRGERPQRGGPRIDSTRKNR